ncbi:hypothetical protein [Petrimonas sp.]|uniref:hypothetical protein n=1 Tax=Petrimonas sp. TaxID=2023866 RepID=UPI003F51A070
MKTKLFISALAVVLSVGMVTAQNQNQVKKDATTSTQNGPAFVDKDNNGVCDNLENGTPRNPNANGKQRLLDGSGSGQGKGQGLRNGQGRGQGKGTGLRNGKGYAANFVDANKNGICDRRE